MRRFKIYAKFVMKTLAKPIGTVFEIDYGKPSQRKVNRFRYAYYALKEFNAIHKRGN